MSQGHPVIIIAPFDASSRYSGASMGAYTWLKLIKEKDRIVFHGREKGELLPYLVEHEVRRALSSCETPIVLGGDHSITYHALVPICSLLGRINLVHFDAHHDAYAGSALNHYTVMSAIQRRLPITLFGLGYRHESDRPDRLRESIKGPTYVSIDVDYFDSRLVPSVGHAVPCLPGQACDLDSLKSSLDSIDGPIVGADIVEWYGSDDTGEINFLLSVFESIEERLA